MQSQTIRFFGGMEKEVKEELGLGVSKLIPLAIWWSTWKGRNGWIFEGKAWTVHGFKLYFLRTLYGWSQVLNHGAKLSFLDFVYVIIVESLRAWRYFVNASFCIWMTSS